MCFQPTDDMKHCKKNNIAGVQQDGTFIKPSYSPSRHICNWTEICIQYKKD